MSDVTEAREKVSRARQAVADLDFMIDDLEEPGDSDLIQSYLEKRELAWGALENAQAELATEEMRADF